jgi:para-aminobenzoate synthetase / 4-amino-4-deoxychorismate lyase
VVPVLREVERATDAGRWAVGFVAYEAAAGLDPTLAVHPCAGDGLPLAWFGITDDPVRVDPVAAQGGTGYAARWERAWTPGAHHRDVERVRAAIARGETYQCNLTVRLRGQVDGDPFSLYGDLALGQRGAHGAYLDTGRFAIASASPELFFARSGDDVLLRPMKGTAARGIDRHDDLVASTALRASAKERAENVMIVDLIRNDVARVARTGTVRVPELLRVERYETVFQLTSDVVARLRPGVGLTELFRALFPSGSVTGAPKASTMALIRELEPTPRGVYCGAIGFVGPPGADTRFSVAIRTATVDRATGRATYGVGSGITWSSDAAAEHDEVVAKTAVLDHRPGPFELVETMRHDPGRGLRNRDRHLRRLADSAEYLGFRLDRAAVVDALAARLAGVGPVRVRLRLSRDGAVAVDLAPLPPPGGPVTLAVDDEPVDPASRWLRHKTTRREVYERRRSRHPHVDDVVLVNDRGELTETTIANLAVRRDGTWWTPPLASGCLPGVERGRLLDRGRLVERVLRPADLAAADAVAVLSSLRGWRTAVVALPDALTPAGR